MEYKRDNQKKYPPLLFNDNAGLQDGIALLQGCQIIWLDVHVNTFTTIYHVDKKSNVWLGI